MDTYEGPERRHLERRSSDHSHDEIERILDLLDGPRIVHLDGSEDRIRERGLDHRMRKVESTSETLDRRTARIEAHLKNGLRLKLTVRELAKLGVLIGGLFAGAVVAIVQAVHS